MVRVGLQLEASLTKRLKAKPELELRLAEALKIWKKNGHFYDSKHHVSTFNSLGLPA